VDLEVQEAILIEELKCDLHPTNERDLSVELHKACMHVDKIDGERADEAEKLSQWVVRISIVMVNLGLLPIQDIPQLLKLAWEVLPVVHLVFKCLQEVLASNASPWD
jgi:hypothetical protein